MTPLQDKLRAAFRETADEIPAEAPPLHLSPQPRAGQNGRHTRWRAWAVPPAGSGTGPGSGRPDSGHRSTAEPLRSSGSM